MADIKVSFHPSQMEVFEDPSRFKIVIAGRRFGKTYYMVRDLGIHVMMTHDAQGRDLRDFPVYYVAPTRDNAKRNTWRHFKNFLLPVTSKVYEKDLIIRLNNGRELYLHGAAEPDALRGDALHRVGLDEFADMKTEVWEEVTRPMLTDLQGGAVFIGSRKPACNLQRLATDMRGKEDWATFRFDSLDNPFMPSGEIESAKRDMSTRAFMQEYMGSGKFEGGEVFEFEHFDNHFDEAPVGGMTYVTMDPMGFKVTGQGQRRRVRESRDYHAIACVTVDKDHWYVHEIKYGHWDTREASLQFILALRKYRPAACGIEEGALKQAMTWHLDDLMKKYGVFASIQPLKHGNQNKQNRIRWALEGRFEKGNVSFNKLGYSGAAGSYLTVLREQALNFPNPLEHDDLLDALAYVDQLAVPNYMDPADQASDYWNPDDWSLF